MSMRIKGQEVSLVITAGGEFQEELTDVVDFNATLKFRKLEQGYLGKASNDFDEIFDGADLAFKLHLHGASYFTKFIPNLIKRATRELPDLVVNVTATMFFPSGETPRVFYPDLKFGPNTKQINSRGDYIAVGVDASVSMPKYLDK